MGNKGGPAASGGRNATFAERMFGSTQPAPTGSRWRDMLGMHPAAQALNNIRTAGTGREGSSRFVGPPSSMAGRAPDSVAATGMPGLGGGFGMNPSMLTQLFMMQNGGPNSVGPTAGDYGYPGAPWMAATLPYIAPGGGAANSGGGQAGVGAGASASGSLDLGGGRAGRSVGAVAALLNRLHDDSGEAIGFKERN